MRQYVLAVVVCAALIISAEVGVAAQPHTAECTTIGTMLGGSGTFKGLGAEAQTEAADVDALQASPARLQTNLAAARQTFATPLANGDPPGWAYGRDVISPLQNCVARETAHRAN